MPRLGRVIEPYLCCFRQEYCAGSITNEQKEWEKERDSLPPLYLSIWQGFSLPKYLFLSLSSSLHLLLRFRTIFTLRSLYDCLLFASILIFIVLFKVRMFI